MRFDYQNDFDQNGVIYWVATKGKGFDTHWENPHVTREIRVSFFVVILNGILIVIFIVILTVIMLLTILALVLVLVFPRY